MAASVVEGGDDQKDRNEQAAQPNSVTVLPGGVSVSYEESEVAQLAAALATAGVRPQDRVLIVMADGSGFAEAVIGTIRQGAAPLPVNPEASADDLVTVATTARARLVVVSAQRTEVLAGLQTELTVPVDGPQGTWATVVLLGSRRPAVSAG